MTKSITILPQYNEILRKSLNYAEKHRDLVYFDTF